MWWNIEVHVLPNESSIIGRWSSLGAYIVAIDGLLDGPEVDRLNVVY